MNWTFKWDEGKRLTLVRRGANNVGVCGGRGSSLWI